jgi:diadenosine tetraphosphatase ApaH/serine/threonine PP2A family protein phosphatase
MPSTAVRISSPSGSERETTLILALIADVHANLEALRACLAHAGERGAGRFAFLGDMVGYGADPGAVVDLVAQHAARGAIVVKGNHDEAAAEDHDRYFNEAAAAAIRWTRDALSADQKEFLAALPLLVRDGRACFVHASAAAPARWEYVDSPASAELSAGASATPYTFSGHVHRQTLYGVGANGRMVAFRPRAGVPIPMNANRAWLAIAGSVGQPRDGDPSAAYALADLDAQRITFHRVPYDNAEAARKVRAAGLPEALAYRLERGA